MASVALDAVYLSDVTNPADILAMDVPGVEDEDETFGEVRGYANGRQRSITRAGSTRTITIEPDWMARDEVEKLKTWRGRTVLYRDPTGRKMYAVFYRVSSSPYVVNDRERVAFTLTEVTLSDYAA